MVKVALGQFAVKREWQENADICIGLMDQAYQQGARLLVLPEAVSARDTADPEWGIKAAQPLDGPFLLLLLATSLHNTLTTVFTVHVPEGDGRVFNALIVIRQGRIIARYDKLHLYDAFTLQESRNVTAGDRIPPLVDVDGINVGLMTCYDIRFPELARRLALDGADLLVLPSAWVRGPLKEMHWQVSVIARALENTCYVAAVGECGPRNIGNSMVVDPLGVTIAQAAEGPALVVAEIDAQRIAEVRRALPVLVNRRFAPPQLL
ncbi:deaminated glutathione amidase [Erwinia pyrifoliae]|uniref:deaminated glutathione amidase n=1 Tax=Erwinia pyrifoliae TaxID=79967 RepID=UPI0001961243|nr:deaminated glutathione amidase [Erwinia pyrifoliae]AUX72061.1 hydrolase [Erwinia pyrifoliae]MCA8877698.1 deaminated glutathione amidase [Erwinia pyrifoliae]UXK13380.1 deaminated glutathione amidase [Erwinia pyrifoliae]CAX56275.1 Putative hydrolase [Erwinia pyrifoliae Ep1/96]CAY75080.1 Aliphatic amidase [Erwinia pyrifoliae DSM 12163]